MSNLKKYNIYVFVNSFTRVLSSFFIPLILYDKGLYERKILLFYLILYVFCLIWILIYNYLSNKFKVTTLMFISGISFSLTYYYLGVLNHSIYSLVILSILFSNYLVFNNIGRHIYAVSISESKRTTENTTMYQIFNILGTIFSSFISLKIIKYLDSYVTLFIILGLMIVSVIPLISIRLKKDSKSDDIIKTFPKRNYVFIVIEQLRYILNTLFPLFIYMYIKNKYEYISIVNSICGFGSIIYVYFISKKMDKNKKNYLRLSCILLGIVYIFKINIFDSALFLIVMFFEGVFKSSLDVITLRNIYIYAKNYNVKKYICFIEIVNNLSRIIFLSLFYIFDFNIKLIIFVGILGIFVNSLILFDDGKYGYGKNKK